MNIASSSTNVDINDTYNAVENDENQYVDTRSAALYYIGRGWQITTDTAGATYDSGWTHEDYSATSEDCKRAGGVGIKTGPQSANLVVIDPDMPIAIKAADRLLPRGTLRSGHSGNNTHAFFNVPDLPEEFSRQFTDGGVIVEILAEKRRVAAPPSKHKSGNRRQWKQTKIVPSTLKAADVLRYARMIATTHWVAKFRPDGGLHAWELSVFGDLMKNRRLTADEAFDIIDVAHEESGWYDENERKKRTKLEENRNSSEKLDLDKLT